MSVQQVHDVFRVLCETQRSQNRPLRDATVDWEGWRLARSEMERLFAVTQVGLKPTECGTGDRELERTDRSIW